MIGKTISHYKILEKLGEGGMGVVYKARDTKLDRFVALKFLPPQYTIDSEIQARFKREAKAIAALNHPNIITIYEIAEREGQSYIAMEYVDGESLKDVIAKKELSIDKVIEIASQICEGLQAAHQAGIVHRDIKPANILLEKTGRVKIVDFGLAKLKDVTRLTKESSTMGTLSYMSPEQIQSAEVDQRSDIFSVGVVLYEMITGQLPFKGDYEAAVSYSILHEEPEPLARYKAGISDALQRMVDKALSKDTNTRYQSAADLLADLKGLLKEPTIAAAVRPWKKIINRQHLIFAGVGLLLALAIYIIFSLNDLNFFQSQKPATVETRGQWQNSIAVLPFENISPDPEQEYFCDGMTEQIITNLSQLQALKVIARTSVMKFKNTEKTIPEIGEELHVAHILEGSIRKVGNRIRVTAQLIEADEGYHLWAKDYDRELEDVFAVQDDVSEAIARALLKKLTTKEVEEIKTKQTKNSEAYEYYLKGEYFHYRKFLVTVRMEDFRKSEKMFKKAIDLDPNYALAHAGLADLYNSYTYRIKDDKEYGDLQQNYIERAFRLDPNSAYVNRVKSYV
ncbi:MAG: protein kinase, partial [bacterium]